MKKFAAYIPAQYAANAQYHGNVATFEVPADGMSEVFSALYTAPGLSLKLIDASDERKDENCFKVWYVFGVPQENLFVVPYIRLEKTESFPSVANVTPAASMYERKIETMFGLTADGNPDHRRTLLHENWPRGIFPLRKDFDGTTRPKKAAGSYEFQRVEGEGIYEIPVGPIHAGIIEPGHFRFSVAGESIMLLEARLGYVHKGIEKLFERLPLSEQVRLSQKVSGDSSFSHSLAFCQAVESLAGIAVPERAKYLRTVYAELERMACHIGDIGFIMLDTGFNFGGSNGARLREMVMRINERLTGSRFLRGVNAIGGVTKDISKEEGARLTEELTALLADFSELVDIAEGSAPLLNRLKTAGPLGFGIARDYGAVGVPARAVGIPTDARAQHPYAAYGKLPPRKIALAISGDVYSRFLVRAQEVRNAVGIIQDALVAMPDGPIAASAKKLVFPKRAVTTGVVEGWRGEIVYLLLTDKRGEIDRVIVRDPSFINWQILGYCGSGQIVPDFPLINKSFNLSYTGNDL